MSPPSQTVWISHRGYKKHCVENTLEAFQEAVSRGFTVLETDLRLCRDGHIVLSHDATLKRLCDDEREIASLSRDQLRRIPLGGGARLLFFDEFMEAFPGCRWILDVKPEHGEETIKKLSEWAQKNDKTDLLRSRAGFLVWKSGHKHLTKKLFPGAVFYAGKRECIRAGLAVLVGLPALGGFKKGKTYSLTPRLGNVELYRESIVTVYRRRGARLLAFLPENEEETKRALRLNFDEILTDGDIIPP